MNINKPPVYYNLILYALSKFKGRFLALKRIQLYLRLKKNQRRGIFTLEIKKIA